MSEGQFNVDNVVRPWFRYADQVQKVSIFNQSQTAGVDCRIGTNQRTLTATAGLLIPANTGIEFDQIWVWDEDLQRHKLICELLEDCYAVRTGATTVECMAVVTNGDG